LPSLQLVINLTGFAALGSENLAGAGMFWGNLDGNRMLEGGVGKSGFEVA